MRRENRIRGDTIATVSLRTKQEQKAKIRARNSAYIEGIKQLRACAKCGEARTVCLDFHHIDHNSKEFGFGEVKTQSLLRISREIDKCMVLCSNCHRVLHATEELKEGVKQDVYPLFE